MNHTHTQTSDISRNAGKKFCKNFNERGHSKLCVADIHKLWLNWMAYSWRAKESAMF